MSSPVHKKIVVCSRSFRLIDFHISDERPQKEKSDSDDESTTDNTPSRASFVIQMFGVNEKGETCAIFVNDYKPFFYVSVGDKINPRELMSELQRRVGYCKNEILDVSLTRHKKLYGFSAGKDHPFAKITFKTMSAMNRTKRLWYNSDNERVPFVFKTQSLELYESSIPPLLRYFHIQNISPSGWVQINTKLATVPATKTTTCNFEFACLQKEVKPMPEKETRVPYKICSFDIEASSSHGDFPIPIKTYKRLASNIIDAFQKHNPDSARSVQLLQTAVLAAFGYARFDDIDLVFPKTKTTKDAIEKLIQQIVKMPIKDAEKMKALRKTNTILSMLNPALDADAGEEDECDDVVEEDEGASEDEEEDDGEPKYYKKYELNAARLYAKISAKATIVDVLRNGDYTRDQKIGFVDTAFVSIFPLLEGDKATFIGSTFMLYGESAPYLNHCIVLGSCDPVAGAVIETVDSERALLLKWTELIQSENPDIIIGYNIFGFDYEFMFRRAQENRCEREFLMLSRKMGDLCAKPKSREEPELVIENAKVVLASGEYDLRYFKTAGRLQIDMYTYFRRDFNLSSYKLDDVASSFISDDIKCVVRCEDGTTELHSGNLTGLNVGDFIRIEITGFTSDFVCGGQKFPVVGIRKTDDASIIVIDGHHDIDMINKSVRWGMAKDDVSPQDIFRLANGSSADRAIVAKYCIQDCNLVSHLLNKIDVITGYVEMSRICSVPISFLVFRGQGIKLTSYVAKKCREKNTLMPDLEKKGSNEGYEGAIVLPPKCSMYMDNPVACVDYASLYPSSMISQNYSHDSKVWTKEYDLAGNMTKQSGDIQYDNLPEYQYIDVEFDAYKYERKTPTSRAEKVKCGKTVCRWAQLPDNQKSIMPAILEELLRARADTRKQIKTEKDPFMRNILDKRQLGYKVTANSLYGQCGAKTSTFYEKDVAASTTATGRTMIIYAKRIIEEVYGNREYETKTNGIVLTKAEYVYGDSVANYTPVYVRSNGMEFDICTIENLAEKYGSGNWVRCVGEGKQEKEFCELEGIESWTETGWTRLYRVIRHQLAPHKRMWRIQTPTGLVDATDDHSLLTLDGKEISPKEVRVGTELLHCCCTDFGLRSFCDIITWLEKRLGYTPVIHDNIITVSATHLESAIIYKCATNTFGLHAEITSSVADDSVILIIDTKQRIRRRNNQITEMYKLPDYTGFVYDLTTENHHFAAGVGNMIVHNTDSVFFTFNLQDPKTGENIRGKKALEITIEIAQDAAHLCSSFLKAPMDLTYEKTLMPFVLLSKKRYVGMLYETNPNKGKLKYMGLSLKRRDACDYLKDTYGGILNCLMSPTQGVGSAIDFLNTSLDDLIVGKVAMDKLTITRALRSDYKNPKQIAHRVLADRIGERDPGNKPKPGDRVKYVFVAGANAKALMGDRIETPEFIVETGAKIDYSHYITNQLMKPLQQLFGLAVEMIWIHQRKPNAIKTYRKDMEIMERDFGADWELFMKKKEKYCSAKVRTLLFDRVLNKISNEKNKLQDITAFFR